MKFEIFEIDPESVIDQITHLATEINIEEWTARQFAGCVLASAMANVAFSLYTTLRADAFARYTLAEAARQAFEAALSETWKP